MRRQGLTPTLHHAEPIKGENRELVNPDAGHLPFRRSDCAEKALRCLRYFSNVVVIVNRSEEAELLTEERQQKSGRRNPQGRDRNGGNLVHRLLGARNAG